MKSIRGTLILVFALIGLSCSAAPLPVVKTPPLTPSPPISWEGKKDGKIEYVTIAGDTSISLENCSNITIYCSNVHSIKLTGCHDISIQNCWIHDSADNGITAGSCTNLVVQGCRFEKVSTGLWACDSRGIQFIGNYAENVLGPVPRGGMVQFDNVKGGGNAIANNYGVDYFGKSHPEDCINIFQSEGTSDSPIRVDDNYVAGDPVKGSEGKSQMGSGIMLGDVGGRFIVCRRNVVINAGQCGIGVAGGDSIQVENNTIIGWKSDVSNVGLYAWNQSKKPGGKISLSGNHVVWTNHEGEANGWWQGSGFSEVKLQDNQFDDQALIRNPLPSPPTVAPMPPLPVARAAVVELPWAANVAVQ